MLVPELGVDEPLLGGGAGCRLAAECDGTLAGGEASLGLAAQTKLQDRLGGAAVTVGAAIGLQAHSRASAAVRRDRCDRAGLRDMAGGPGEEGGDGGATVASSALERGEDAGEHGAVVGGVGQQLLGHGVGGGFGLRSGIHGVRYLGNRKIENIF